MDTLSPHTTASGPNVELLRSAGWAIASFNGPYCVAWRGLEEVVFEWHGGEWHRVGGRTCGAAA